MLRPQLIKTHLLRLALSEMAFPQEYGHDAPTAVNFSNNQHKK
jgi:hypothetical protein